MWDQAGFVSPVPGLGLGLHQTQSSSVPGPLPPQPCPPLSTGCPLGLCPGSALTVPSPPGYFGYMNVTKIPAGATHIKVTDKSRNYLGRTRPVSVPVRSSWSWLVPPMGAGRVGQGVAVPCRAVPVPPLRCCFEHHGFSELAGAWGNFPEAAAMGFGKG